MKSYSYSQLRKMDNKRPIGKRAEIIVKYGADTKFQSHTVRLLNQAEQILSEGDLDLERSKEQLKDIRDGHWTPDRIREYFYAKEPILEAL